MTFRDPLFLILFLLIPLVFYFHKRRKDSYVRFSSAVFLKDLNLSLKGLVAKHLFLLRFFAIAFLIFAIMRPQTPLEGTKIKTEGIDIILAIDASGSMLAEDFKIGTKRSNRLAAVKEVVEDFIEKRTNDRMAMVVFAARPYTVCPLTSDYNWLKKNMERVEVGMVEDGTAIGCGIAASLNRLKSTQAKSKIIILLTDGRNNMGDISPLTAAEAAAALGVKVYTIGAGTTDYAPYPGKDFFGNKIYRNVKIDLDEPTLKEIAAKTGAKYFRATDTDSLRKVYQEIDKLEKSVIEEKGYLKYNELFYIFVIAALVILLSEIILANTVFVKLP